MKKTTLTQEQIAQFKDDGYLIVRSVFDAEEIQPLLFACENDPEIWSNESTFEYSNGQLNRVLLYSKLSDSLLGVFPRMSRLVNAVEALLGEECYHFHSKLVRKEAHNKGNFDWHQDYGTWYHYGLLFPNLLTAGIAITDTNKQNGCMQALVKSHLMGRINHVKKGDSEVAEPERVQKALEKLEMVDCEMNTGDVLFFHGNLLHASTPNYTDRTRVLLHCTYNTASNEPYKKEWKANHSYQPLKTVSDSIIKESRYNGIYHKEDFSQSEKIVLYRGAPKEV